MRGAFFILNPNNALNQELEENVYIFNVHIVVVIMAVTNPLTRARKKQALAFFQANQLMEAKRLYAEICKLDRRDADAWNMLSAIHGMSDEYVEAENCCRQVIAVLPNEVAPYNNLGNALKFQGKLNEAEIAYRQALQLQPNYAEGYNNLGNLLKDQGKSEEAINCYQRALKLQPDYAEVYNNMAGLFRSKNKNDEALACYMHALRLNPDYVDARYNIGALLYRQNKKDEALACFQRVLQSEPDHVEALMHLGGCYLDKGALKEAEAPFRRAMEINPSEDVHYMLAMLGVEDMPAQSPGVYIKDLFNSYADNFDAHLTKDLSYRAPEMLLAALLPLLGKGPDGLDVLDLGCGTGLCGLLFRNFAHRLVGVDLSPSMIDMARNRGIYDELLLGDVTLPLLNSFATFDLILSTDVFIYIGDLRRVFELTWKALKDEGTFAFSTETAEDVDSYELRISGRYAHAVEYIRRLASDTGFSEVSMDIVELRQEMGKPMMGNIFVYRK